VTVNTHIFLFGLTIMPPMWSYFDKLKYYSYSFKPKDIELHQLLAPSMTNGGFPAWLSQTKDYKNECPWIDT
jgi:hypothetical protein